MFTYSDQESFEEQFLALSKELLLMINPTDEMRTFTSGLRRKCVAALDEYLPQVSCDFIDGQTVYRFKEGAFEILYSERGNKQVICSTEEYSELVYLYIKSVTQSFALAWELNNRIEGQDSRRLWFSKQIELIGRLNLDWASKLESDINQILLQNPYNDSN